MNGQSRVLYEVVADDLAALIGSGTLGAGARVPSIWRMSQQRRVSIATVVQAYRLLEDRGLIEARPQSGYYVRTAIASSAEPAIPKPPRGARLVGVQALVDRVLQDAACGDVVPLGAAIPDVRMTPVARLQRIVAALARRHGATMATYVLPPGREELRRQIALRVRDWGVRLDPDDIVITHGCMEARRSGAVLSRLRYSRRIDQRSRSISLSLLGPPAHGTPSRDVSTLSRLPSYLYERMPRRG